MTALFSDPVKLSISTDVILHRNAATVYAFLSFIHALASSGKILDCGAGGPLPPLALFAQHGFTAHGIDIDPAQLNKADQFCQERALPVHFQPADMRHIPYEDAAFDYVYEHYSMCHLSKADTQLAVNEMHRVLKPQGLCFLGVISTDTWPHSFFGEERASGEFYGEEGGLQDVLHSMWSDREAESLISGWEIISQEKHIQFMKQVATDTSLETWQTLRAEAKFECSPEGWQEMYARRTQMIRYVHLYFLLKKFP